MQLASLLAYAIVIFVIFTDAARLRLGGKIRIGYVGSRWGRILQQEVIRKKYTNIEMKEVKVELQPRNLYSSILEVDNYMQNNSHDVILGDHSISLMSVTGIYNIPYLDLDTNGTIYNRILRPTTVLSFPIPDEFYARAIVKILQVYKVEKVAILIDETADYKGFLEPFFTQTTFYAKVWTIHSRATREFLNSNLSNSLKYLRKNGYLNIVLKASLKITRLVIERAHYFAMVASPHRWYFPRVVCEDFGYTNLWHINTNFTFVNDYCNPSLGASFFGDQVLVMQALDLLRRSGWSNDPEQLKKLAQGPFTNNPFMSPIQFDANGIRTNVTLQLHTPTELGVMKIGIVLPRTSEMGYFHSAGGERLILHTPLPPNSTERILPERRRIRVVGVVEHPHLIKEKNGSYVGFGVDLMNVLAKKLNFTYELKLADHFGNQEGPNTWTGVMDDLLSGRADMTLGPLVQNSEREDVIDFSTTFKQREISVVMRRPRQEPTFFQFARPFDIHVWGCVIASIIFMSFTLWLVELGSAKANKSPTDFNLRESAWYIIATTVQGGTELIPRSLPGRILSGTLYFFVLILTTSYTANLAAFLTVKSFNLPITKVEDLAGQKKLKFGTVRESSVLDFFAESDIPAYRSIFSIMNDLNPTWLVNTSEEGFKRARNESYAFIWDDSVNEYEVNIEDKNCELMVVGRPFGKRSFAIGLPQGSRLKEDLDKALLTLIDTAKLENLEHKWWRAKSRCKDLSSGGTTSRSLTLFDVAGVLLVLFCGCGLAILALIAESFVIRVLCGRRRRQDSKDRHPSSRQGTPGPAEHELMLTHHSLSRPLSNSNNGHDVAGGSSGIFVSPSVNASNSIREFAI